ncbi:hypothetical protein CS8_050030 [Cupriavidus sp. 8B]
MLGGVLIAPADEAFRKFPPAVFKMNRFSTDGAVARVANQPDDSDVVAFVIPLLCCLQLDASLAEGNQDVRSHDDSQINQAPEWPQK